MSGNEWYHCIVRKPKMNWWWWKHAYENSLLGNDTWVARSKDDVDIFEQNKWKMPKLLSH